MLLIVPSYPDPTGLELIQNAAVRVIHYEVGRTDDWGRVTARVYRSAAIATADPTKHLAEFRVVMGGFLVEPRKPTPEIVYDPPIPSVPADPGDPGIRFPTWGDILAEVDAAQVGEPAVAAIDQIDRVILTHLSLHPELTGSTIQ